MVNKSSGKLLHIEPQQFDSLLIRLIAKTPPKTQTAFSVKQFIARLQDFIAQSLENQYTYDEIAPIILASLVEENIVEVEPELKASSLRQYYLEVQRETASPSTRKRKSTRPKNATKHQRKTTKSPDRKTPKNPTPKTSPAPIEKHAPTAKSAENQLAY
jgi:outer membrane biosynthesis protein TonB